MAFDNVENLKKDVVYHPSLLLKLALPILVEAQDRFDLNPHVESKINFLKTAGGFIDDHFDLQLNHFKENTSPQKLIEFLAALSLTLYAILESEESFAYNHLIPRATLQALYDMVQRDITTIAMANSEIDLEYYDLEITPLTTELYSTPQYILSFVKQYGLFLKNLDAEHVNQGKSKQAQNGTKSHYTQLFNQLASGEPSNNLSETIDFFNRRMRIVEAKQLPRSEFIRDTLFAIKKFCEVFAKETPQDPNRHPKGEIVSINAHKLQKN